MPLDGCELPHFDHSVIGRRRERKGRILYDIPCKVCQDHSSGKHYGIFACDGCAGFFKRSIRRNRQYVCKSKADGSCLVDKTHRNQCRACRLTKCVQAGMNKDAVQHERGPRNSTLRRQMSLYFKDSSIGSESPPQPSQSTSSTPPSSVQPPPTVSSTTVPHSSPPISFPIPSSTSSHQSSTSLHHHPDLAAFALNRFHALTTRPATLLAPTPKVILLENSWRELFILSATQFLLPIEASPLLAMSGLSGESSEKILSILQDIKLFQETSLKFKTMAVDPTEYACLKAIVLFKTVWESNSGETKGPRELSSIAALQDQSQLTLNKYISTAYPSQPFRFGKLLLLLPSLKAVGSKTIEEIFFRRTIGVTPIERIIADMFKTSELA
ncbi:Nuclear receptor subfamily 2 group E member 1 [Armadillidium nasatum]|uniref:Nuclear receptor subfamily 2 group E member 1 n=1 Tax=Armadillidium nasatum TaxID=96803 RepID=A0A5N5SRL8_9CRUS|nr:Nuclear receptor subfamily 2 group E member 1 [Armadillidium nasatum]